MYAVDLHTHTRFFHGFGPRPTAFDPVGVRLLLALAARRGLDGVALTNHDYVYRVDEAASAPAEMNPPSGRTDTTRNEGRRSGGRRDANSSGPVTIPGIEISTTRGHLLVIGPDPPETIRPGRLTPDETVELAHDRGCVAILAHPFRNSVVRESSAAIDAVELNGKTATNHDAVRALAADRDLPIVGGSDAHYPFEVGRAFTRIDAPELTPHTVVDAIRDDRVEPVIARPDAVQRVLEPAYRLVHRGKGHIGMGHQSED